MISVRFQGKLFNITVIQVCALTGNAEEPEVQQSSSGCTVPLGSQGWCPKQIRLPKNLRTSLSFIYRMLISLDVVNLPFNLVWESGVTSWGPCLYLL